MLPAEEKNPYTLPDGSAQFGFLREFLNWERDKELKRRESLSEEERKELDAADRSLQRKMNS